jgi:hypothetical protein
MNTYGKIYVEKVRFTRNETQQNLEFYKIGIELEIKVELNQATIVFYYYNIMVKFLTHYSISAGIYLSKLSISLANGLTKLLRI